MVKHNTVGRRFNPVKSKKRRSHRRKSRYSDRTTTNDKCVAITLKDVGDIDDKELNTIPSSIQGEASSWEEKPDDKSNDTSFSSHTNPLLQVESVDFCQLCTKRLLDIHENEVDGAGEVCDHQGNGDDGRRKHVAQSLLKVFQSLVEGRFDESKMNIIQSNTEGQKRIHTSLVEKKCRTLNKAMNTSNKDIKCSLSKLSIAVMCTSESTLSTTGLTQQPSSEVLQQPHRKLKPEFITKKRLETIAGALLMELSKVTAEKSDKNHSSRSHNKLTLAKDSYVSRLKNAKYTHPSVDYSALDSRLPQWLRDLCQGEDQIRAKRGILKKARSHIDKSKINIFRPLLCTKLSIPWLLRRSLPQITCMKQNELGVLKENSSSEDKHSKTQHHKNSKDRTRESKKENLKISARRGSKCSDLDTKVLHAYNTRNVHYCSSYSVVPIPEEPSTIEVPLRLFASNTIREVKPTKKKRADNPDDSIEDRASKRDSISHRESSRLREKQVKDICPKCKSSIQCSIALRSNAPKVCKIKTKTHNVLAYPCKRIVKKTKPILPQERNRQQQERTIKNGNAPQHGDPTTKYFIKSFFTGTSTSETTKPVMKTTKKNGRRRKNNAPTKMSGRPHVAKKRRASPTRSPRRHHHKTAEKHISQSDIEVDIQNSEEMDIINQHIRAHKTASDTSPVFHTCFKRLLDKELKAQSGWESKTSRSRKLSKGGYFIGRPPPEVKKFNEGIFSCLIPKVFK